MLGRLGCRECVPTCVPNEMVSIEGDGSKDHLKSVSIEFPLANDVPQLSSCDGGDGK